ncbi:low affinity sulfate transporter 3-like isoform X2 [Ipomoea triloba]|nr:low affinity sulfate transporter 3-like isoform X2 [Ipomoea triloba]
MAIAPTTGVEMTELELSYEFSQTLQKTSSTRRADVEETLQAAVERASWVLNVPEPPGLSRKLEGSVKKTGSFLLTALQRLKKRPVQAALSGCESVFPPLSWGKEYSLVKFKSDVLAGLTLASLCIPQSIGYAALANLDPQYGLYTSVVPPLIYAVMGSSREIAIGPVAVVSLLISSMVPKLEDPATNPAGYTRLVLTVTFFAGTFQAAFGILRLGFLVDFLSHAAIVGFMAGAAIVIGLQQLKPLFGISNFTNKTDVVSVLTHIFTSLQHYPWNPYNLIIGFSFLSFILVTRFLGQKHRKLFWLPAMAPLLSVILSTLFVYLTRAENHGVKIVKHVKGGLNPSSLHQLQFNTPHIAEVAKIGFIVALVALTEAIAVGRSFASMKGYHLDGNKEMLAIGVANIAGSLTSCYAATGSFSRSAVNFYAGCETAVSNVVMAVTVLISLQLLTRLLYFTPVAILASIILSALPGLINLNEAYSIWKVDKLDFLACAGAFAGILFASVEIGLLVAVGVSFAKIILNSIQPGIEKLGRLPGAEALFMGIDQYPMAAQTPGVVVIRTKSSLLCFANANFIKARILSLVMEEQKSADETKESSDEKRIVLIVFDMSNIMNVDTSAIVSLKELYDKITSSGVQFVISNPRWQVIHKLRLADFHNKIKGKVFLSIGEAIDACLVVDKNCMQA